MKVFHSVVIREKPPSIRPRRVVCSELALLIIPDYVSETLFNLLDIVCIIFGDSSPDSDLTDQNL